MNHFEGWWNGCRAGLVLVSGPGGFAQVETIC